MQHEMHSLTHPDLPGRVIVVDEHAAKTHRISGWSPADDGEVGDHACPDCPFVAETGGGLASHRRTHEDDES